MGPFIPSQQAGGTVARAKRTDRAEARRRYRATLVESDQPVDAETDADDAEEAPARPARARSTATAGPPPRPSMVGAFRGAFRPLDLRGDVAALPGLLLHRSFFIPLATIVVAAVALIATSGKEPISASLAQYFLYPPPLGPVLIAGFMAPRASWLLGGLLGIIAILASIIIVSMTGSVVAGTTPELLAYSAIVSALGGGFYAASAAWYRRFLAMASPSRNPPRPPKPGDRNRRRDANNRPLLARRR
jgi:hypothetical protein